MLHEIGSRKIPVSRIEISDDIALPVRRALLTYPAMLSDSVCLTPEAVKLAALQAPMVVYEKKSKNEQIRYCCIGNLRTFFLAKRLGEKISVRSTVVKAPRKMDADNISLMLTLSEKSCFLLAPAQARSFLISIYELLDSKSRKEILTRISPAFKSRTSFLESYGLNRRV